MQRALIVGMGISGMATAIRLKDAGWTPVIIERSTERRTGGYFIGLFPEGRAAAGRLGVLPDMHLRTPERSTAWEVDSKGSRSRSTGFLDQPGKPDAVLRGDIEAGLWTRVDGQIEIRYGTVPTRIEQGDDSVDVTLLTAESGSTVTETFDLVVGADGLRSTVRSLVFGAHEEFMHSMNAMICAFQMTQPLPDFQNEDAVVVAEQRRALWVFPFADRPPTGLFTYRTSEIDAQFTRPAGEILREQYAGFSGGGAIEHALAEYDKAGDAVWDSVHQVKMDSWHRGNVVVLGDSAWCLSLYSGMGATSGMAGAVALGDAIVANPTSLSTALDEWEKVFRPVVDKWRSAVPVKSQVFVPSNALLAGVRRIVLASAGRRAAKRAAEADQPVAA